MAMSMAIFMLQSQEFAHYSSNQCRPQYSFKSVDIKFQLKSIFLMLIRPIFIDKTIYLDITAHLFYN